MSRDDEITVKNEKTLRQLALAIASSQGQFKLMLVRCNYASWRSHWIKRLQDFCAQEYQLQVPVLELQANDTALYNRIKNYVGKHQLAALQVVGWEKVTDLDTLLRAANQIRETLRGEFPFPLLLWLDDRVLTRLMEVANDLHSWSTSKRFLATSSALLTDLEHKASQLFERILETDDAHEPSQ